MVMVLHASLWSRGVALTSVAFALSPQSHSGRHGLSRHLHASTGVLRRDAATRPDELHLTRPRDEAGFRTWFAGELADAPNQETYGALYADAVEAVVRWRRRFEGEPALWKRVFKSEKVVKELIESTPVIHRVRELVARDAPLLGPDERFTIVDLCSGKGYLSMLLSELLPPDVVDRFVLVDIAWPRCGADVIGPGQMNWEHIYGSRTDEATGKQVLIEGFKGWPIPLVTSKQNLKNAATRKSMSKAVFGRAKGPVLLLAVHLCGTLSLRAVEAFHEHENVALIALKPCCLPGIVHVKNEDVFTIGGHSFPAAEVASSGKFRYVFEQGLSRG